MSHPASNLAAIERFLAQKRIAMVGISHDPKNFSVSLFDELCRRGYEVIPVNPKLPSIKGWQCLARVQDIRPPVTAALLMTSPEVTESVVADCAQAGIRKVWMYRAGIHGGAVSQKAIDFCNDHGIEVIPGECPYMFLPRAGLHRVHGFFRKLTGRFPRRQEAA